MPSDSIDRFDSPGLATSGPKTSERLHYLDWLRVLLILGVFLYHALHPFDSKIEWHIKNDEQSIFVMILLILVIPWGLPLFFLVSGAGSKFSLRRRSNRQYIRERVLRLAIPFVVGSILLTPLQKYFEALHKGNYEGSFFGYLPDLPNDVASTMWFSPLTLTEVGLHLWFLAFLFLFSVMAVPIFNWFRSDAGRSFVSWLGRLVEARGGILLFLVPLTLVRALIQPFFPEEHSWLDFVASFLFFVMGYVIYTDDRFLTAIRRDRWLLLAGGLLGMAIGGTMGAVAGDELFEWTEGFVMPWSIIVQFSFAITAWCLALFVLDLARTHLNTPNRLLAYGNESIMPFYLLHQPVIIVIAYYVVRWDTGILPKMFVVVIGSFVMTMAIYELLIRRVKPLRALLGIKPTLRASSG
ncbi:MAG: acyltransferase family protein [Acidimicrobiia bacterium]|nr:acyltransferase family protein [Acidimicrobiia bacterium]